MAHHEEQPSQQTQQHFTTADISEFESRYRARFINSLSGFKSANLVGTIDADGSTNLSVVSSVFHIGASPALVGMIIRPDSVPRDTLSNIKLNGTYTLNHVSANIVKQAHQASARYDTDISEFDATGLTAQFIHDIAAPFVQQSQLKFALEVKEITPLTINNTTLVIGEVIHVIVNEGAVQQDGYVDIESLQTVCISGLDSYHTTERLSRLSYAKTDSPIVELSVDGKPL